MAVEHPYSVSAAQTLQVGRKDNGCRTSLQCKRRMGVEHPYSVSAAQTLQEGWKNNGCRTSLRKKHSPNIARWKKEAHLAVELERKKHKLNVTKTKENTSCRTSLQCKHSPKITRRKEGQWLSNIPILCAQPKHYNKMEGRTLAVEHPYSVSAAQILQDGRKDNDCRTSLQFKRSPTL